MEWLTPLTALYAAAITVPLLLLLYFLKLKRQEQIVSSTFLWKRAVHDMQVNAPFQKLRHNILLLLQLLMLISVLIALAWPILSSITSSGQRYVILIDRSASMNTVEEQIAGSQNTGSLTRLDEAKRQAKIFVESLRNKAFFSLRETPDKVMVIAFDNHSKLMCNFTSDKQQLISAIEAIEASHGGSSIGEALVVAQAFAQSPGEEANNLSAQEPAKIVLLSDGQIKDIEEITVGADELIFHCIGETGDNIAITAMQARRSYENPNQTDVFATVANFSTQQVSCDVQLSINNNVKAVKKVLIPPVTIDDASNTNIPGKVAVNFSLTETDSGLLEVRHLYTDSLNCDNAAWAILSAPERLSVLLVTAGNIVLESALNACPFARVDIQNPEQFDAMDYSVMNIEQPYDIIVLDNYLPEEFPKCQYIVFGKPPDNIDVTVSGELENQVIVDWKQKHPVLQYVNLLNLFSAKAHQMVLPRDAEILAEFNETPALALIRRNSSVFLLAGFDILQTNWPFEPSFILFCYNASNYLGMQTGQNKQTELFVNEPIIVEGLQPEITAYINGPEIVETEVKSTPTGSIRFANTSLAGAYTLNIPDQLTKLFAVNMLDIGESDIQAKKQLDFTGQQIIAQEEALSLANLPLWPYFTFIALILACIEWLIYTYKVRI